MSYKWYIDTFVTTLFLVDLVAYMLAACFLGKGGRIRRCLLLAAVSVLAETYFYITLPWYFLYRLLMLCTVNPLVTIGILFPCKKKDILSGYLLITAVIIFLGGIQMVFLYWWPSENGIWMWNIILAAAGTTGCFYARRKGKSQNHIYEVELMIHGRRITIRACHDTGNFLRDPFTGKPVNVVDLKILQEMDIQSENLRYIPFHTVGQEHGLMQVMTIEKMVIRQGTKEVEKIQPVIGLAEQNVFLKQDIQMILHSEMM